MPFQYDTFDEWAWQKCGLSLTGLRNRLKDTVLTVGNAHIRELHAKIRLHLQESSKEWKGYDYGHGYLYQSSPSLRLAGRRDTSARLKALSIERYIDAATVLDIGCNSGFISLEIAQKALHVTGFDVNPFLVMIASDSAQYLRLTNTTFLVSSFAEFSTEKQFDAVLSLSNHFTYDGDMSPTVEGYLERCKTWLKPGGAFIFESHTPKFEARHGTLDELKSSLDRHFKPLFVEMSSTGTALDRNRMLYIGALPQ
jgi:2-polyprenyl-3-methyl-5-hydroxy-6-metoxy-1,4-benzoquinol methylase